MTDFLEEVTFELMLKERRRWEQEGMQERNSKHTALRQKGLKCVQIVVEGWGCCILERGLGGG